MTGKALKFVGIERDNFQFLIMSRQVLTHQKGVCNSLEIPYRLPEILWNQISTDFEIWNLLQLVRYSIYFQLQIHNSSITGGDQ